MTDKELRAWWQGIKDRAYIIKTGQEVQILISHTKRTNQKKYETALTYLMESIDIVRKRMEIENINISEIKYIKKDIEVLRNGIRGLAGINVIAQAEDIAEKLFIRGRKNRSEYI